MKRAAPLLILALILAAAGGGFVALFRLRVGQGDVFPEYSSLRADPLGVRAFHDSLAALPGIRVTRNYQPVERLEPLPPRTIFLAGLAPADWTQVSVAEFSALDAAVRSGSRLVVALNANQKFDPSKKKPKIPATDEKEKSKKPPDQASPEAKKRSSEDEPGDDPDEIAKPVMADLAQLWGIGLKPAAALGPARRTVTAAADLPEQWVARGTVYLDLSASMPWRVLYRRNREPVMAEMARGLGSIVVINDTYFLSNESLQKDRLVSLLSWLVGPFHTVEFDEAHLGVIDNPGVAALARRYGLAGAFFTLLVLAGLYVWQRMMLFVPPADEVGDVALVYNQTAGLEALLRRAVLPHELSDACAAEWRRTARPAELARFDRMLADVGDPKSRTAVARYNAVVKALRAR